MVPIVRSLPAKVAMEMLLTGIPITARRAHELGMVNRVVPADQLDTAIEELTRPILATSRLTVEIGKTAFHDQYALSESEAYQRAVDVMTGNAMTHDAQEGDVGLSAETDAGLEEPVAEGKDLQGVRI